MNLLRIPGQATTGLCGESAGAGLISGPLRDFGQIGELWCQRQACFLAAGPAKGLR